MLRRLHRARLTLTEAFARKETKLGLVAEGYAELEQLQPFVARVMRGGGAPQLLDDAGEVEYELSSQDQVAVQAYMDGYVFVLSDLLPLVLQGPDVAMRSLIDEDSHPVLRRRTVVQFLRLSWWHMLTSEAAVPWAAPLFGALASVARSLRPSRPPLEDGYWGLVQGARTGARSSLGAAPHLRVIAEPLLSWNFARPTAFRRAVAWLAVAEGRVAVENAERLVKGFESSSLRWTLEHAADWPIFDLLRDLASRAGSLMDDGSGERDDEADAEVEVETSPVAGYVPEVGPDGSVEWPQLLRPELALEFYRMLHVFGSLCDAFGLRWWVSHGTLIGALRDAGLSRHADDCEVDIAEADVELLQGTEMRGALARNGYELSYDPRGRCFKVWPVASQQASRHEEDVLRDQAWWLPQQFVGTPALDVYIVETPEAQGRRERRYVSNEEFHCNARVCDQVWQPQELAGFASVAFGAGSVRVPSGAGAYLSRVYGADWNATVRPHRWASRFGGGFAPVEVRLLRTRRAGPVAPLPLVVVPSVS